MSVDMGIFPDGSWNLVRRTMPRVAREIEEYFARHPIAPITAPALGAVDNFTYWIPPDEARRDYRTLRHRRKLRYVMRRG